MQAFGGLFLENTSEGGLTSVSRDWSVVTDDCISAVTVGICSRSATATIFSTVCGVHFNIFILLKIRGVW